MYPESPEIVPIELGNVDANRDWSDAEDMVHAVWRMLNQEQYRDDLKAICSRWYPGMLSDGDKDKAWDYNKKFVIEPMYREVARNLTEYVVANGESHTVREFVQEAFKLIGINGFWTDKGIEETYRYNPTPEKIENEIVLVKINPSFYRPAEVNTLQGDPSAIKKDLKWFPKTSFYELVKKMVNRDVGLFHGKMERTPPEGGA
jgi:GDP-D-mannose dehydratase